MVDLLRPSGYIDRILSLFTTPTFEHTQTLSRVTVTLTSLKKDLKSFESELKTAKATSKSLNTQISPEYRGLLLLKGHCYKTEAKRDGFDYEVCLFKKAVQIGHGKRKVTLGRWGKWIEYEDGLYILLEEGDRCWNGPERSLKVSGLIMLEVDLRDSIV